MNRPTFELLILGCSSAMPTTDRGVSAQLLNVAERLFLIDCGEGTQIQLRRYKARLQSIDQILISHLHGDHFFGLPGLLSTMHLLGRRNVINIYAPPALEEAMASVNMVSDTHFNFPVRWHQTRNDGMHLLFGDDKVEVYSFPLNHRIFCTGFLIREQPLPRNIDKHKLAGLKISYADIQRLKAGFDVVNEEGKTIHNRDATIDPPPARSYAYCSDTAFDPRTAEFVRGADLLYHESTFLEDHNERAKKTFHSTAIQAATVAAAANVKKLLLGHYSSRYRDLTRFTAEASAIFSNCMLASDGDVVKI